VNAATNFGISQQKAARETGGGSPSSVPPSPLGSCRSDVFLDGRAIRSRRGDDSSISSTAPIGDRSVSRVGAADRSRDRSEIRFGSRDRDLERRISPKYLISQACALTLHARGAKVASFRIDSRERARAISRAVAVGIAWNSNWKDSRNSEIRIARNESGLVVRSLRCRKNSRAIRLHDRTDV